MFEKWSELGRSVVRPLIALSMVGGLLGMQFSHIEVPEAYWGLLGAVVTFYFVSREKKV